jgi:hypothetical protein
MFSLNSRILSTNINGSNIYSTWIRTDSLKAIAYQLNVRRSQELLKSGQALVSIP